MTNLVQEQRPGKRERLVASAARLLYEEGAQAPTLAEIAEDAEVPPGNVYYYFKARDELVRAVIRSRAEEIRARLAELDRRKTPAARLKGLTRLWLDAAETVAAHGCPLGSLCTDLRKYDGALGHEAGQLLRTVRDWAEAQFREMGRRDAGELSTSLIAQVQGAAVLSNALGDPTVMSSQVRRLQRWIDGLAKS